MKMINLKSKEFVFNFKKQKRTFQKSLLKALSMWIISKAKPILEEGNIWFAQNKNNEILMN